MTALLADKGLDKLKNVAKTGKTADNVADIAEGAAKGAGNVAEDAAKAGKELEGAAKGAESAAEDAGKVVESGLDSIIKNGKVSIDDLKANPSLFSGKSVDEIAQALTDQGIIKIIDGSESLYKTDGKETATIIFSGGN